jgi:hypothetical protein
MIECIIERDSIELVEHSTYGAIMYLDILFDTQHIALMQRLMPYHGITGW